MAAYRLTCHFVAGISGWSESIHLATQSPTNLIAFAQTYATARASFLSNQATISSIRISDDELFRDLPVPINANINGVLPGRASIPDSTCVFDLRAGAQIRRFMWCRGLPSDYNDRLNINLTSAAALAILAFRNFLKNNGIAIYAKSLPSTAQLVTGYNQTTGIFTVLNNISGIAVGKYITITAPRGVETLRGQWKITTVVDPKNFALLNWPLDENPVNKANVRLSDKTLSAVTDCFILGAGERRAGRPFGLRVGRATRR